LHLGVSRGDPFLAAQFSLNLAPAADPHGETAPRQGKESAARVLCAHAAAGHAAKRLTRPII